MGPNPICLESGKKPCEDRDWAGGRMPVKAETGLGELQARNGKIAGKGPEARGRQGRGLPSRFQHSPADLPG